jgi:hypothetical protein
MCTTPAAGATLKPGVADRTNRRTRRPTGGAGLAGSRGWISKSTAEEVESTRVQSACRSRGRCRRPRADRWVSEACCDEQSDKHRKDQQRAGPVGSRSLRDRAAANSRTFREACSRRVAADGNVDRGLRARVGGLSPSAKRESVYGEHERSYAAGRSSRGSISSSTEGTGAAHGNPDARLPSPARAGGTRPAPQRPPVPAIHDRFRRVHADTACLCFGDASIAPLALARRLLCLACSGPRPRR